MKNVLTQCQHGDILQIVTRRQNKNVIIKGGTSDVRKFCIL